MVTTTSTSVVSSAPGGAAWRLAAFALAALALVASVLVIFGSDGDASHVRWPLVVAPLVLTLLPLVVRQEGVRLGALVLLGLWCAVTVFSIGMLFLPALAAALMAIVRDR